MMTSQRSALRAAGFAAVVAVATVSSLASAQRQQLPGPDTKRVLVTAFRGDVEGGTLAAKEIRDRISREFSVRQLVPTSKQLIDTTLMSSGYKPDSALSPNDIKELAKLVRGDEIIDGTVQRTATGYRLTARMFLPRDVGLSQPLVTNLETSNLGDAAKQIVSEYDRARRQIPSSQACENGLRANTPALAITAARLGIASYPKATIARLCLASTYSAMNAAAESAGPWKDSVIAITKVVLDLDNVSRMAYQFQIEAYKQLHDTANLVPALMGYMRSDPTNAVLREQVIAEVIQLGKADVAAPIAKTLVDENPGDPGYLKTYWLVLRTAKMFKESVKVGESIVAIDSAAADTLYYMRQIQDLVADSGYARAVAMAAVASAKFPARTDFLIQKAQNERRTNQLPAAKVSLERALQLDPKVNGANYLLASIAADMGNSDDAIKFARADAAVDPLNKARDAALLLQLGNTQYKAAVASKAAADYKQAIPFLQASDEMSPSANAKFLLAVSAFQAVAASTDVLRASRSCEDFKSANELLMIVNINMGPGGSVNPEVAKQILGGAAQYAPFIDGSMKKFCK